VQELAAFKLLDDVFGTFDKPALHKKNYMSVFCPPILILPTAKITNPDVTRLRPHQQRRDPVRRLSSRPEASGIRSAPGHKRRTRSSTRAKAILFRLNPYAKTLRRQEIRMSSFLNIQQLLLFSVKQERIKAKNAKKPKQPKAAGKAFLDTLFAP
jgi:large subunit ribosomal protein L4e